MADRLSALLSQKSPGKREEPGLTERSPTLAVVSPRPDGFRGRAHGSAGDFAYTGTVKRPSPPLGASLPHSPSGSISQGSVQERCHVTNQTHQPGPGRSTSDAAFTALTKEIAERTSRRASFAVRASSGKFEGVAPRTSARATRWGRRGDAGARTGAPGEWSSYWPSARCPESGRKCVEDPVPLAMPDDGVESNPHPRQVQRHGRS
jgi:hypothetical protein